MTNIYLCHLMARGPSSFGDRRGVPLSGTKCMLHTGYSSHLNVPFRELPLEGKRHTGTLETEPTHVWL